MDRVPESFLASSSLVCNVAELRLMSKELFHGVDVYYRSPDSEVESQSALKLVHKLTSSKPQAMHPHIQEYGSKDLLKHVLYHTHPSDRQRWRHYCLEASWTILLSTLVKMGARIHECRHCHVSNATQNMKSALFDICPVDLDSGVHQSAFTVTAEAFWKLLRHYGGQQSRRWLYIFSHMLAVSTGMLSFPQPLVDASLLRDAADIDLDTDAPAIVSIFVDDSTEPVQCGMSSFLMKNKEFALKMVSVSHDSDTETSELSPEQKCTGNIPAMGMRPFAFYSRNHSRLADDTQKELLHSLLFGSGETTWNVSLEMEENLGIEAFNDATRRLHLFAALSIYKSARIRTFEVLSDACDAVDSPLFKDLQLIVVAFLIGDDSSFVPSKTLKGFDFRFRFLQLIGDRKTDFVEFEPLLEDWLQRIFADVCLEYDCGDVAAASALQNDDFVRYLRTDAKRYTALLRAVLKCLRHTGTNPHATHDAVGDFVTAVRYAVDAAICSDAYDAKQFCALLNALLSKHRFYSRMALKCLSHVPKRVALAVERDYARGGKTALMNAIEFRVDDDVFERIVELSAADLNATDTLGLSALDYTVAGSIRDGRLQEMGAKSMAKLRLAELREAKGQFVDGVTVKNEKERLVRMLKAKGRH